MVWGITMEAVKVINIKKTYSRLLHKVKALRGVSFEIEKGTSVGLVGPNGAGKSTLVKIMSGLLYPDSGKVYLHLKQPIGYVQEEPTFLDTTVYENIMYVAELNDIPYSEVDTLFEKFGLSEKKNKLPSELSHGQKKRLALLRALLPKPEFLILDEPFSGLDPSVALWMKRLILKLKEEKATLFISSHNLPYLMPIVDDVIFINNGKIIHRYPLHREYLIKVVFEGRWPESVETEEIYSNKAILKVKREKIPELIEKLVSNNVKLYEFSPAGLEEVYEKIYGGGYSE